MSYAAGFRRHRAFLLGTVSLALLASTAASAQQDTTYFGTPWILQPTVTIPGEPQPPANDIVSPVNVTQPTQYSDIFGFATQVGNPKAPPYQLTPRGSLYEVFTDNADETHSAKQSDLISSLSLGLLAGADTPHLTGLLDYTGVLQDHLHESRENNFSNFGFATAHATILPGAFYINFHATASDVLRAGGGLVTPVIQNGNATHVYIGTVSPYFSTRMGDLGVAILRYNYSRAWFDQNTGPIPLPGLPTAIGPITGTTEQQARADFKFPGTLVSRLSSNVSLGATSDDTGRLATGEFERAEGELINEFQLTRSLSLIGGAGYEALKDSRFVQINGQGPTWDLGGRWQPNSNSSVLMVYGRHDLKSDIGGEVQYRITPFTSFYAAYTDSIATSQNNLIASNDAEQLNPAGPVSGITYDQSSVLSTLNDASLAMAGDPETLGVPLGLPLSDVDNFQPVQNDIYRTKRFQSILYSNVLGNPVSVVAYDIQQDSLTGQIPPHTVTKGVNLNFSPTLSPQLFGLLTAGYNLVNTDHAKVFNVGVGARYTLSETLSVGLRYDLILRDAHPSAGGYVQNAVTLSINKNL